MIQRLGFTLHLDTGVIDYLSSNPIVYQGSQSSYYMDFDFKRDNQRVRLDDYTFITVTFRRSDGNVSSPLTLERETEQGTDFSIFSKLLNSGWYFEKAGNLAFSLKVCKRVQSGVDANDDPVYTTQILTTANGYINVVASASFDSSAPIPPSAYEDLLQDIEINTEDIDSLDERLTALDDEETGEVPLLKGRMDTAESDIDNLELRMGSAEDDIDDLQDKAIKSIASGTPTNNYIEIIPTYYDGDVGNPVQIQLAGTMATEEEATSIANNAVTNYNANTVQPKFTQLDNELSTAVHYDTLQNTEQVAIEVVNAANVTDTINNKALSDIFESNGTTVKNATDAVNAEKATKDASDNIITSTYETKGNVFAKRPISVEALVSSTTKSEYNNSFASDGSKLYFYKKDTTLESATSSGNFNDVYLLKTASQITTYTTNAVYVYLLYKTKTNSIASRSIHLYFNAGDGPSYYVSQITASGQVGDTSVSKIIYVASTSTWNYGDESKVSLLDVAYDMFTDIPKNGITQFSMIEDDYNYLSYFNVSKNYTPVELALKSDIPTLATVATSGSYSDLSNKPTIQEIKRAEITMSSSVTLNADEKSGVYDLSSQTLPSDLNWTKVISITSDSDYVSVLRTSDDNCYFLNNDTSYGHTVSKIYITYYV